jgi:ribokinase
MAGFEGGVLVAGAINTDLVARVHKAPAAGETVTGTAFNIFGGGKGANQAISAARSGGKVAILGAVGEDDFGRQRRKDLEADGILTDHVGVTTAAASGVALIVVDDAGQNRISYVPGATLTIEPEAALAALHAVRPTVVSTTLELPAETLKALYREARALGATIINNATPEPAAGVEVAKLADILIANETEAFELLGLESGDHGWVEIAGKLRTLGPKTVIVTLGGSGAVVAGENQAFHVPAPKVEVVDTTGAGDAFCGAFAVQIANGADLEMAVMTGICAGSISVSRAGAQPSMAYRHEIEAMLEKLK